MASTVPCAAIRTRVQAPGNYVPPHAHGCHKPSTRLHLEQNSLCVQGARKTFLKHFLDQFTLRSTTMLRRLVRRALRRHIAGVAFPCDGQVQTLRALNVEGGGRVVRGKAQEWDRAPEDITRPVQWLCDSAGPECVVCPTSPHGPAVALAYAVAATKHHQAAVASSLPWQDMHGAFDPAVVLRPSFKPCSVPRDIASYVPPAHDPMPVDPAFAVIVLMSREELQKLDFVFLTAYCGAVRLPGIASALTLEKDVEFREVAGAVCTRVTAPDFARVSTLVVCLSDDGGAATAAAVGTGLANSGRKFQHMYVATWSKCIQFRM